MELVQGIISRVSGRAELYLFRDNGITAHVGEIVRTRGDGVFPQTARSGKNGEFQLKGTPLNAYVGIPHED